MIKQWIFISGLLSILLWGCQPTVDLSKLDFDGPPTIIYKTTADYSLFVPVVLNEEKNQVIAYPAPKDLYNSEGELRFPLALEKGYYLDEIGVGLNTAYTSLRIKDYARMLQAPPLDSLYGLIIDKDPFKSMYNLGNRKQYQDENKVKDLVNSGGFKAFQKLK